MAHGRSSTSHERDERSPECCSSGGHQTIADATAGSRRCGTWPRAIGRDGRRASAQADVRLGDARLSDFGDAGIAIARRPDYSTGDRRATIRAATESDRSKTATPRVRREVLLALRERDPADGQATLLRPRRSTTTARTASTAPPSNIAVRHRPGAARGHPRRLRQALPRVERQGRRPGLGAAADVGAAAARASCSPTPKLTAAAEGPHRGHPRRQRRPGRRQDDARRCSSRDAAAEVKARALENLRLFLPTKWKGLQDGNELDDGHRRAAARTRRRASTGPATDRRRRPRPTASTTSSSSPRDDEGRARRPQGGRPHARQAAERREPSRRWSSSATPKNPLSRRVRHGARRAAADAAEDRPAHAQQALEALQTSSIELDERRPALKPAALSALAGEPAGTVWLLDAARRRASCRRSSSPTPAGCCATARSRTSGTRRMLALPAAGQARPEEAAAARRAGEAQRRRRAAARRCWPRASRARRSA